MDPYRALSIITAALTLCLAAVLLLYPGLIFLLLELTPAESTVVIARRASMLFLGFTIIVWQSRNTADALVRQTVAASLATSMLGLAFLGTYEFFSGSVGPGVWMAIAAETTIGVLYLQVLARMFRPGTR